MRMPKTYGNINLRMDITKPVFHRTGPPNYASMTIRWVDNTIPAGGVGDDYVAFTECPELAKVTALFK